jgi:Transcriptional regulator, AbiEi antitoxin
MGMLDDHLAAICRDHGVFLRREALGLGLSDRAITQQIRAGDWVRVRHGAYTFRHLWEAYDAMGRFELRSRAAYRTAKAEVVLSHTSSLSVLGTPWWDLSLDEAHLTRRDGRVGRREAGVVQHCGRVSDADVEFSGELAYMNGTRTALEICTIADVEHSLVVVNGLLRAGKTSPELLRSRYVDMEMWPRTLTTELVLRLCDHRPESVAESRWFYSFHLHNLPCPVPQHEVRDGDGRLIARLDFAWPELGVWVEVDGKVKYDELRRAGETPVDVLMREKRREEAVRAITGWECIRVTWADLFHPERVVDRIRAAATRRRTVPIV